MGDITEIDGVPIIHTFTILYEGWEMDNLGWVTSDGRVWTTSHGGKPYEMDEEDLSEKISEAEFSLTGMRLAGMLRDRKQGETSDAAEQQS